ncbi:MAG: hypothetical protein K8R46_13410, partial [Pirellulales bacterium]|nr:hypothetical protein [Pirellulales bacterium]
MHDATGTGELSTPDGFEPRARAAYSGVWYDPLGQQIAAANFGTVPPAEGRPEEPPARSDDVLVSSVEYDSTGMPRRTVDAKGREDRSEFDAAGRVVRTVANYSSGS